VLHGGAGWKALVYSPSCLLHDSRVLDGPDHHAVMELAKLLIDKAEV
jgi:hypothetical protein